MSVNMRRQGVPVLSLHSWVLRDRLLFPCPWPSWESTQNWDAVSHPPPPKWMGLSHKWRSGTECPALKPKLQISFYAYALPVSNLILHSCLTARERFREREGIAWIHLRAWIHRFHVYVKRERGYWEKELTHKYSSLEAELGVWRGIPFTELHRVT